ncbi:MAG: ABC transporter permease [Pseudomonadota bacterium]
MAGYLAKRLVSLVLSLAFASVVIFAVVEVVPGDPATFMLGLQAEPETVAALQAELGLTGSKVERYFAWVGGMIVGDFGVSYTYRTPVSELVLARLGVSVPLTLYAIALSILIGVPLGMLAAAERGRLTDTVVMSATQFGIAVPNFWFAMLLVLFFAIWLGWFSAGGFPGWEAGFWPSIKALTLPAFALAVAEASILARVMRSSTLETLSQDYIRTARAKGLSRRQALFRHAFRNALIPVMTIIGLQIPFLIAGAIVIENVFFLPGLGRLVFQAITQRDLIVVESVVTLLVFGVILVTFLIDIAYAVIDPRLRRR